MLIGPTDSRRSKRSEARPRQTLTAAVKRKSLFYDARALMASFIDSKRIANELLLLKPFFTLSLLFVCHNLQTSQFSLRRIASTERRGRLRCELRMVPWGERKRKFAVQPYGPEKIRKMDSLRKSLMFFFGSCDIKSTHPDTGRPFMGKLMKNSWKGSISLQSSPIKEELNKDLSRALSWPMSSTLRAWEWLRMSSTKENRHQIKNKGRKEEAFNDNWEFNVIQRCSLAPSSWLSFATLRRKGEEELMLGRKAINAENSSFLPSTRYQSD